MPHLTAYSGDLAIGNAGSTPSALATVTALDFTLNNSFAPTFVIGDSFAASIIGIWQRAEIEGSFHFVL
jgi:ABC-type taurine transport system substrate-binding protein